MELKIRVRSQQFPPFCKTSTSNPSTRGVLACRKVHASLSCFTLDCKKLQPWPDSPCPWGAAPLRGKQPALPPAAVNGKPTSPCRSRLHWLRTLKKRAAGASPLDLIALMMSWPTIPGALCQPGAGLPRLSVTHSSAISVRCHTANWQLNLLAL